MSTNIGSDKSVNDRINSFRQRYIQKAVGNIETLSLKINTTRYAYYHLGIMFVLFAFGWIVTGGIIIGIAFMIPGYFLPDILANSVRKKRFNTFNEQLVDGIVLIANSLRAGFSFLQALDMLVSESKPPLSDEFSRVMQEHRLGGGLEDAFTSMEKRIPSEELKIVVTATLIARETGGNLAEVYDKIAKTLRDRRVSQDKIKAMTSQGKMQGIVVGLLPVLLGAILSWVEPELMYPVFHTPAGWGILAIVAVLELIGFYLIRKIITIDV